MPRILLVVLFLSLLPYGTAQSPAPVAARLPGSPSVDVPAMVAQIDQTAQTTALQIASLRIEKWKTESQVKQQAQHNADSLQRNMTAALPSLTGAVRTSPQDLSANFKLYRNLSALSDVLNTLAESAGAFGPRQEFEALAQSASQFDDSRRALGDYLESLTAAKEAELARLRAAGASTAPATRPRKIIVDNEPEPRPKAKKRKQ